MTSCGGAPDFDVGRLCRVIGNIFAPFFYGVYGTNWEPISFCAARLVDAQERGIKTNRTDLFMLE